MFDKFSSCVYRCRYDSHHSCVCWFPSVHDNPGGDQDPRCPQTDTGGAGGARDGVGQRYEHHRQSHGTGDPPPTCEYYPCQILHLMDTCICTLYIPDFKLLGLECIL